MKPSAVVPRIEHAKLDELAASGPRLPLNGQELTTHLQVNRVARPKIRSKSRNERPLADHRFVEPPDGSVSSVRVHVRTPSSSTLVGLA